MPGWVLAVIVVAIALIVVLLVFGRTKTITVPPATSPETTRALNRVSSEESKPAPRARSTAEGSGPLLMNDGFVDGASPRTEVGDSPSAETAVLETGQGDSLATAGHGDVLVGSQGFFANMFGGIASFFENLGFDFDGDGDGGGDGGGD
jgi:hypothetical protein